MYNLAGQKRRENYLSSWSWNLLVTHHWNSERVFWGRAICSNSLPLKFELACLLLTASCWGRLWRATFNFCFKHNSKGSDLACSPSPASHQYTLRRWDFHSEDIENKMTDFKKHCSVNQNSYQDCVCHWYACIAFMKSNTIFIKCLWCNLMEIGESQGFGRHLGKEKCHWVWFQPAVCTEAKLLQMFSFCLCLMAPLNTASYSQPKQQNLQHIN